jgi:hypothetical protein
VIFACGLLNFFWLHSAELDYIIAFLSSLVIFFAVLQVKPPISTLNDSLLDKIRLGTAFQSSTYFFAVNVIFGLLLSPINLQSSLDYLDRLIAAFILLLGMMSLQRVISRKLAYGPLESQLDSDEYSLYAAYYFSSTTFSIVLAVGGDLLVGTLSYLISLVMLATKSGRVKGGPRLFSSLNAASDRFVRLFRRNVMNHPGAEAFLGLTGIYLIPLTILTNFEPTIGILLLTSIMAVPPILSAATALRFSFKSPLYAAIPLVLATSVWLILAFPDAYPPAESLAVLIQNSPISFSSQELSVLFVLGIYSMSTATYMPLSRFLPMLQSDRIEEPSIEKASNSVILGAVIPEPLIVAAYVLLFNPDTMQLAWIIFSTLLIIFFVYFVVRAIVRSAVMDIRDRSALSTSRAHFVVPPCGGFYAMIEHFWNNDLYSLIAFPECLAMVAIGRLDFLEWFTPSVMEKRDAVEEARLLVIRKRTSQGQRDNASPFHSPISLYELASTSRLNRLFPAKNILGIKVGESRLSALLNPRAGILEIRTSQSSASFNICFGQNIVDVKDLLLQIAPGKVS